MIFRKDLKELNMDCPSEPFVGSSVLLQTPECSEYHPPEQSLVVSWSRTKSSGQHYFSYQAPAIRNQRAVSVRHSALSVALRPQKP